MHKGKDGNTVYNRAELTEDRCRQSKSAEMVVSRNFLQDLLNDSAKLSKIRVLCELYVTHTSLAERILRIIKEKL